MALVALPLLVAGHQAGDDDGNNGAATGGGAVSDGAGRVGVVNGVVVVGRSWWVDWDRPTVWLDMTWW